MADPHTGAGADREWASWLGGLLTSAAERLDVYLVDAPKSGLRGRTVGARVSDGQREWWLRVVTEPAGWAFGPAWTGNVDADQLTGTGAVAQLAAASKLRRMLSPQVE